MIGEPKEPDVYEQEPSGGEASEAQIPPDVRKWLDKTAQEDEKMDKAIERRGFLGGVHKAVERYKGAVIGLSLLALLTYAKPLYAQGEIQEVFRTIREYSRHAKDVAVARERERGQTEREAIRRTGSLPKGSSGKTAGPFPEVRREEKEWGEKGLPEGAPERERELLYRQGFADGLEGRPRDPRKEKETVYLDGYIAGLQQRLQQQREVPPPFPYYSPPPRYERQQFPGQERGGGVVDVRERIREAASQAAQEDFREGKNQLEGRVMLIHPDYQSLYRDSYMNTWRGLEGVPQYRSQDPKN